MSLLLLSSQLLMHSVVAARLGDDDATSGRSNGHFTADDRARQLQEEQIALPGSAGQTVSPDVVMQMLWLAGQNVLSTMQNNNNNQQQESSSATNPAVSLSELAQLAASCPTVTYTAFRLRRACVSYAEVCEFESCAGEIVRQAVPHFTSLKLRSASQTRTLIEVCLPATFARLIRIIPSRMAKLATCDFGSVMTAYRESLRTLSPTSPATNTPTMQPGPFTTTTHYEYYDRNNDAITRTTDAAVVAAASRQESPVATWLANLVEYMSGTTRPVATAGLAEAEGRHHLRRRALLQWWKPTNGSRVTELATAVVANGGGPQTAKPQQTVTESPTATTLWFSVTGLSTEALFTPAAWERNTVAAMQELLFKDSWLLEGLSIKVDLENYSVATTLIVDFLSLLQWPAKQQAYRSYLALLYSVTADNVYLFPMLSDFEGETDGTPMHIAVRANSFHNASSVANIMSTFVQDTLLLEDFCRLGMCFTGGQSAKPQVSVDMRVAIQHTFFSQRDEQDNPLSSAHRVAETIELGWKSGALATAMRGASLQFSRVGPQYEWLLPTERVGFSSDLQRARQTDVITDCAHSEPANTSTPQSTSSVPHPITGEHTPPSATNTSTPQRMSSVPHPITGEPASSSSTVTAFSGNQDTGQEPMVETAPPVSSNSTPSPTPSTSSTEQEEHSPIHSQGVTNYENLVVGMPWYKAEHRQGPG
jgi:hypothetical protein